MLIDLKQFVPSDVCLSCEGCCRFHEEKSSWRPKITQEEVGLAAKCGLCGPQLEQNIDDEVGFLRTVFSSSLNQFICSFFSDETKSCKIYLYRPFECQLYPFLLIKKQGKIFLGVHGNCPYVQVKQSAQEWKGHVEYLKKFFSKKKMADFLKRNPALFADYLPFQNEIEYLFELS